ASQVPPPRAARRGRRLRIRWLPPGRATEGIRTPAPRHGGRAQRTRPSPCCRFNRDATNAVDEVDRRFQVRYRFVDLGLTNKTAMVGGASKGLGYAVARALAAEGAHVSIASRDGDAIRKAADTLSRETGAAGVP